MPGFWCFDQYSFFSFFSLLFIEIILILLASAIIISSPVQPMIQNMAVPLSVLGQNSTGQFSVVPSQVCYADRPQFLVEIEL